MPAPETDRSLRLGRSFDKTSDRDRFLDGMLGKHLLITDKDSVNIFTRSLIFHEKCMSANLYPS